LRKPWRALAFALLAASAAIVAIRAFAGPFHIGPIAINTPLNIEGVFALLWAAAMLLRPGDGTTQPAGTRVGLWWGAFVLAVVIAMFARALWFPLVSDDYILVTQATHPAGSIWRPFVEPGGDGSYRPIGYAILRASGGWANTEAFRWHFISIAIHAINSLLVYAATRYALKRSAVAALCALLFALHGTRPEAVVWTAGRFDVIAGFFALVGLLLFLRYYETGKTLFGAASGLAVAAAILCKESAYAFPALAVAFVAAGRGQKPWHPKRLLTTLIAPGLLMIYRFILFHGPGGYVDPATGKAQILSIRFLPSLRALFPRFWAAMIFPVDWAMQPSFYLASAIAILLVCLIALCVARSSLDRRTAWILAGCVIAAVLPAVHLLSIGPDLLGSRILYLPAAAFALFLAIAINAVRNTTAARAIGAGVVIFYIATLTHSLGIWGRVADLADRTCAAAAPQLSGAPSAAILGIPVAIDGVPFFANGIAECVGLHSTSPPAAWTVTHVEGPSPQPQESRVLVWDQRTNVLK